ncbi:MAG TPA: response regulator [Jatrophihabitans sp.]|jgi:DNA-binding response OmpR family regulator
MTAVQPQPTGRVALVADDDQDIRDLVTTKLSGSGFTVIAVSDGDAALIAAREKHPDIALLDVMMPGPSGLEIVRLLREDPATATIPVILLSAKSQEFDVEAGLSLGAADYVVKPFSPRDLVARVEAALSRART